MSKIKNTIESLIERARALSYDDQAALADHLLDQLATPAGGLAVLRAAAGLNLEAAATALALYERQCQQADADEELLGNVDEEAITRTLRALDTDSWPVVREVSIPALAPYSATRLYEARRGDLTSGLCQTLEEAQGRLAALVEGRQITESPAGQASTAEMQRCAAYVQKHVARDGGIMRSAVDDALVAGVGTVAWAIASRHVASMFSSGMIS